ncbi:MAG TPA: hypothetical protein VNO26_02285, partial [Candidatus Limnocylindria bacterium]|nr:hypothetical protein [Candidatus Limnocylindria bacterium]
MRARRGLGILAVCLVVAACGRARLERPTAVRCGHVQSTRQIRGLVLCEDAWSCERPPGGPLDRVTLTRLAPCGDLTQPLVLYLPDRHHGNGRVTDPREDLRLYLTQAGLRTWLLTYRTSTPSLVAARGAGAPSMPWDFDTFADDVEWAMGFIRGTEASRGIWLAGMGDGATFAYEMADRGQPLLAGIVALDGASTATPAAGGGSVIEAGFPGVSWESRTALLNLVQTAPRSPSPIPGYASAADALAALAYDDPTYGGNGGFSAARDGASDVRALARYLAGADRWWPRAVLRTRPPGEAKRLVPVFAVAAGRRGEAWAERVAESARAAG